MVNQITPKDRRDFRILFPALVAGLIAAPFVILTIGAFYHG